MAKYKRHSQGGRFRTADFGDLGLRAYKDQQNQQIQSLKEQNQQQDTISRGHLQEMRGAASREIEHNRQLQNFYNKRDNLAIENTQFRGKTEYDKLMGEAKEYEKKADFWKNFSETYAAQYAKAAGGIYDAAMVAQSNHQLDKIDADPRYHKFQRNNSVLNNLSSDAQREEAYKILRDPKATKEQINDYLGHIVDLGFRMNHKTKLALINRELENWDQEHINLRSLASNPGKDEDGKNKPPLAWNAETVKQFYYLRARELMRAYDIDPSSKAGRVLLEGIREKEVEEVKKLNRTAKANADQVRGEELWTNTESFIGKISIANEGVKHKKGKIKGKGGLTIMTGSSAIEYNNELNLIVAHEGGRYRMTEQGVVIDPSGGNVRDDAASVFERLIKSGKFKSKEQAKRHTIMQLTPESTKENLEDGDSMTYLTKDTYLGRHPSMGDDFDKWWREYETEQKTEFDADKVNKDFKALQNIKSRALEKPLLANGEENPNYINLSDKSVVKQLKQANAGNDETVKFLSNFEVYNESNLNTVLVREDLDQKFKSGKLKDLEEHLTYLPPEIQDQWRGKLAQLKILERKGYIGSGLTTEASGILKKILGKESKKPGAISGDHFNTVTKFIEQDILATFDEISEDNKDASDSLKISLMRQEIQRKIDNNEGIYRRGNSELSTVFYVDPTIPEPGTEVVATTEQVKAKLKGGVIAYDNLMNNVFNDGKIDIGTKDNPKRVSLVSINDADQAIRNINEGRPVPQNDTIDFIFKYQPKPKKGEKYTKRQIWNEYFKGVGIDKQIPPDALDFASDNYEKSEVLKSDNSNRSEANKCIVGAVSKMCDDGVFDITQKSAEGQRIDQNNSIRSSVLESLSGTLTEQQQKILYPHSDTLRKDTHIPWWIKPWAEKTPTKSPLRLNRL